MPRISRRHVRVLVGLFWLIDAGLQLQPHLFSPDWWGNDLAESVMGQPSPVAHSILWATGLLSAHPFLANGLAIAVQATIGLGLVTSRLERAAITASVPWALVVWWVGEGLGSLPTGFAQLPGGAPGPVLFYPLIAVLAWPSERPLPARAPAVAWSAVWLAGALMEVPWRFPTAQALQANIEQNSLGEPHWLSAVAGGSYALIGAQPFLVPLLLLLLQLGIALGVLSIRTRPYALAAGAFLALLSWVVVQDLGGLVSGSATDPGSGPLLVLLAAVVAASTRGHGIQSGSGTEYRAWSSISRTTRAGLGVSAGTISTSTASRPRPFTPMPCDAFATCTTSSTTPSAI